jgi:hypothetical protein
MFKVIYKDNYKFTTGLREIYIIFDKYLI